MGRTVDARGLSCPQPVILTKRVMDEKGGDEIITLVDNPTSLENVCKLAKSQGYSFTVEELGSEHHIHMLKESVVINSAKVSARNTVALIKSRYLGEGSDELGAALMKSFLVPAKQPNHPCCAIASIHMGALGTNHRKRPRGAVSTVAPA